MPAKPEAMRSHVPGSGTLSEGPPQGPPFFLPLSSLSPSFSLSPFFFPGAQRPPRGNGGGAKGAHPPPDIGEYRLNGGLGSKPGIPGRFSNADWNGTGGLWAAVPSPARKGSSNFAIGGSDDEMACWGTSSIRFAHLARAVILPSVMTFSPL